ncbi:hypothetical protein ABIB62_002214 [Mucilaginibacter sp. UYP25]|uniref:hypothetical protein n=1 Tax=unclassified Mucilaginibacter TaxID=2617802 RepID=UPI0033915BCD
MRRSFFTGLFAVTCISTVFAQNIPRKISLSLTTGYAQQNLKWSIAGNLAGESPNVYSELQWKKVAGKTFTAALQWNYWGKLLLDARYSHVFVHSGTVTDNDYNGENRTDVVYNERFNADKGYSRDWSAAAGYQLINKSRFNLNAYAGYGISTQSFYILDRTGNFPDLNSTYKANWKGPFGRAESAFGITNKLKVSLAATYNQVSYNAAADWNLIQTFQHPVSYRHTAKGFGIDGELFLAYRLFKNITIQAGGNYYTWQTGKGIDELFFNSGESNKTQLNKVERNGYQISMGITLTL